MKNDIYTTRYDSKKKLAIVFVLLGLCFIGAIIVSFVNVNDDFNLLHTFYAGYLGRKLIIREQMEQNRYLVNMHNINYNQVKSQKKMLRSF